METLKDYISHTIQLHPDYEGEATATLISSKFNIGKRRSVLYIHGFVDYFFQTHLGDKFIENNYDFYALDLRKYGRSILPHQRPNYCKDIVEYFEEITIALKQIYNESKNEIILMGHSTGGLIATNYMNLGQEKILIKKLILNSPFFDFNQTNFKKTLVYLASKLIAKKNPYAKVDKALSTVYGYSLHKDFFGEWNYNLTWKPVNGFPTYFSWLLAMRKGHKNALNSNITIPILIMHSSSSIKIKTFRKEAKFKDVVLNIKDIKRVGLKLGKHVTFLKAENAVHDIFLSPKMVREKAFNEMFCWLSDNNLAE